MRVVAFLLFAPGKPLLIPGRIQSHRPCSQQLTGRHHLLVSPGPLGPPRGSARQPPPRAPAPSPASIFLGRSLVSCKRGQGGPRAGKRRGPASGSRTSDAAALSPQTAHHRQGQVGAKQQVCLGPVTGPQTTTSTMTAQKLSATRPNSRSYEHNYSPTLRLLPRRLGDVTTFWEPASSQHCVLHRDVPVTPQQLVMLFVAQWVRWSQRNN